MLAGYYTIASGMLTRQRELDTIGNNLVNAQTPGYRADRVVITPFEQELLTRIEGNGAQVLGTGIGASSAVVGEEVSMFHMGTVKDTGRESDMLIGGEGFFQIQGTNGETYFTRNGHFDIDAQGYLALTGYGRVVGTNGPIQVGSAGFQVDHNGVIFNAAGQELGTLSIMRTVDAVALEKLDNGMLTLPMGVQLEQAVNYEVSQRSLELSNVDMNQEMTYMIEAQRAFQACSSALQIVDALNRKAATQIGNI